MTEVTTKPLTQTVGAEVSGVTREHLVDEAFAQWCLEELERYGALVFRGLHLDDATQIEWSRLLGDVETFPHANPDCPEIFIVTLDPDKNPSASYLKGTVDWHIDGCTEDIPIMATMLSAHAVATTGGETEFASSYGAYDALTDDEKKAFEQIRIVHTIEASQRLHNPDPSPKELEIWRKRPSKTHPLVWTHESGRKSLVLGATTDHVVGMEAEESREFLDGLLARATAPDAVYRHEWEVGDVVIWDNRGVLHRACPYDPTSPREMHRTTFAGDEPIA